MSIIVSTQKRLLQLEREKAALADENETLKAQLEYLAIMTDVELEDEEAENDEAQQAI